MDYCDDSDYQVALAKNKVLIKCGDKVECLETQQYRLIDANLYQLKSYDDFVLSLTPEYISPCLGLKFNEVSFAEPRMFFELVNESTVVVELENCAIRRGDNLARLTGQLGPGLHAAFDVPMWSLKNFNTKVNLYVYDTVLEKDIVESKIEYKAVKSGASWAWFDTDDQNGWMQTFVPTPSEENIYQQFQTCETGKMINPETGNCIKMPTVQTECPAGQYRNPETGRCKKIATASTLVPCPEGSFRNPETNRCKKLASEVVLSACQVGYERNPETNRCRKVVDSSAPTFAVQNTPTSTETNVMIAVAAGVIGVTLAMIIWSFRQEIGRGLNKVFKRKATK